MRTVEDPAYPLGELVCPKQPLGLDHFALCVYPPGLYGVQPRALLGQKATDNPHPRAAGLDAAIVGAEPSPEPFGYVPARVVPDEKQKLLSGCFELLRAPRKELRGYGAYRSSVHEPDPRLGHLGKVESVAGYGFRLRIVFGQRPLKEPKGLALLPPGVQSRQSHPAPPALVLEAHRPLGIGAGDLHQSVAPSFFRSYKGSEEVIHRLARIHFTERRRDKVARTVSPETRFRVSPSSKATSAAISVASTGSNRIRTPSGTVEHLPQSLGALAVEGVAGLLGARGLGHEGVDAPLAEVVDGITHRLRGASEIRGDLRGALAPGTGEEHLRSAHGESVFGAQPRLEAFALLFRERTYKDRSFHGAYCNLSTETYPEAAICTLIEDHDDFVTYGENIGNTGCLIPPLPGLLSKTRQPVLLDVWKAAGPLSREELTTVSNWRQVRLDVECQGETYYWSKHHEFLKFIDLPRRVSQLIELAMNLAERKPIHWHNNEAVPAIGLASDAHHLLKSNGWQLADAPAFITDPWPYRDCVRAWRSGFSVARDLNVRLRSGWFSEQSACYLAASRPVVTQDTEFGSVLPTGEILFAFNTMEEILEAFDAINSDYERHSRTARAIAEEYFKAETVRAKVLDDLGF
jgi:hypothetical protein